MQNNINKTVDLALITAVIEGNFFKIDITDINIEKGALLRYELLSIEKAFQKRLHILLNSLFKK